MANEQAGSNPPENESYDAGMLADVRAAFTEVTTEPTEPVAEKPSEPEPKAEAPAPETKADDRPRDELGRFAKSDEKPAEIAPAEPKAEAVAPQPTSEVQAVATIQGNPPGGWSVKAKAEWEKLPEYIRADILKREKEVNDGFAQYEGMRELRPYVEQARAQGQTVKQVLDSFIGMENMLRQNPAQGFLHIAQRVGVTPQQLAQMFSGYSNSQQGYQQPADGQQPSLDYGYMDQRLNPLMQEFSQIKSLFQQQQESAVNAVIQRFTADPAHRFYTNVEERMAKLFAGGVVQKTGDHWTDLKNAYDLACRMDPEISELLLNEKVAKAEESRKQQEKEAAEKARLASRSITGSPAAGAKIDDDSGDDSIEADVRRALKAHAA